MAPRPGPGVPARTGAKRGSRLDTDRVAPSHPQGASRQLIAAFLWRNCRVPQRRSVGDGARASRPLWPRHPARALTGAGRPRVESPLLPRRWRAPNERWPAAPPRRSPETNYGNQPCRRSFLECGGRSRRLHARPDTITLGKRPGKAGASAPAIQSGSCGGRTPKALLLRIREMNDDFREHGPADRSAGTVRDGSAFPCRSLSTQPHPQRAGG